MEYCTELPYTRRYSTQHKVLPCILQYRVVLGINVTDTSHCNTRQYIIQYHYIPHAQWHKNLPHLHEDNVLLAEEDHHAHHEDPQPIVWKRRVSTRQVPLAINLELCIKQVSIEQARTG